jgi:hypothetical protein
MSSTDRISCCLWCGFEVTYRPNVASSVTKAKAKMAEHELACEESPVVKQMAQLRDINRQLTAVCQVKKGIPTVLENYINPRRKSEENVLLDDLGALARSTADEDDVLVHLRRDKPNACAVCGDITRPAVSMRIIAPTITHIALICQSCGTSSTRTAKDVVDDLARLGELDLFEMAFLWKEGKRTRMLWGDKLQVETIR